tara:strand:+ start:36 stop:500 length:465 start_codon:yes stop_codon:yes gene_type:complete
MSLFNKIIKKLIKKNITISVAESCTGGLISETITQYSGVSKIFSVGIVCYSNKAKMKYLSVSQKNLKNYGAVSHQIALEMINNLHKIEKSNVCIATTGIAGPKGGSKTKPVGLVFIGIKFKNKSYIFKKIYKGSRRDIQIKTKNFIFKKIDQLI